MARWRPYCKNESRMGENEVNVCEAHISRVTSRRMDASKHVYQKRFHSLTLEKLNNQLENLTGINFSLRRIQNSYSYTGKKLAF